MEQRAEIPAQARCQAKSLGGGFNRCLTLGLVLILCLAASLGQEDSAVRFRVTSNLVLVDVGVRDSKDQPVRGLTGADFTVLEGGVRQEIQYFHEINIPLNGSPPPKPSEERWQRIEWLHSWRSLLSFQERDSSFCCSTSRAPICRTAG